MCLVKCLCSGKNVAYKSINFQIHSQSLSFCTGCTSTVDLLALHWRWSGHLGWSSHKKGPPALPLLWSIQECHWSSCRSRDSVVCNSSSRTAIPGQERIESTCFVRLLPDRCECMLKSTPSLRGWCRPTSSHWAPPDPQVWADTQMSTSGPSRPSRWSSSWWPPGLLRGDTGSWSSGGSRWPRPCHGGRETELPLWPAEMTPTPPEPDSCWRDQSVCCAASQLPHFKLLQVFCCPDVL